MEDNKYFCNNCEINKTLDDFYYRSSGVILRPCKECTIKRTKKNSDKKTSEEKRDKWNQWADNNRKHLADYSKTYREKNETIIRQISRKYKESKKGDIQYETASSLRKKLIYYVIEKHTENHLELFGANSYYIRKWIEYQFNDDMSWDNYGIVWNFDHIIPYNFYDLTNEDDCKNCCNWSNIQPLYCGENSGKKDKIIEDLIKEKQELTKKFKQEH